MPRIYTREPLNVRFWRNVRKTRTCWLWTGHAKREFGYGVINEGGKNGRALPSHRVSWMLHFGTIPPGLCVCHHCDNPACVRPDHLFLGTREANNKDMYRKGRENRVDRARGEQHWNAELAAEDVETIRSLFASRRPTMAELASRYGVTTQIVWRIIHNRTYRAPGDTPHRLASLTHEDAQAIRAAFQQPRYLLKDLGQMFHVSPQEIHRIVTLKNWNSAI